MLLNNYCYWLVTTIVTRQYREELAVPSVTATYGHYKLSSLLIDTPATTPLLSLLSLLSLLPHYYHYCHYDHTSLSINLITNTLSTIITTAVTAVTAVIASALYNSTYQYQYHHTKTNTDIPQIPYNSTSPRVNSPKLTTDHPVVTSSNDLLT